MDVTENTRAIIIQAIRAKGLTQTALAEKMGYGKAWVTRLLNGSLKRLSDGDVEKLEDFLGINFYVVTPKARVSGVAAELSRMAETDPSLASVLNGIAEIKREKAVFLPRYIETKDMTRVGQEIIRLAFANEDKPGKVAREVLKLLSE